jgi:transcriptional repressor NrdR
VERVALTVVKRDGSKRESFNREKLVDGIRKACAKRPISPQKIEDIAKAVENELVAIGGQEVSYQIIGDLVMRHLQQVDLVAYVRFASVYKEFKEVGEFVSLVNN